MAESNSSENKARPIPPAWADNPFQAPAAHVEDVRSGSDGKLLGEPNRLPGGRGTAWWSAGWELFREATGLWIGITLALFVASIAFGLIPLIGTLLFYVIAPVLVGGLMLGCRKLEKGEGLSFNDLFAGFQRHFGVLALAGALYAVGLVAVFLVTFLIFFVVGSGSAVVGLMTGSGAAGGLAATSILLLILIAFGLSLPLMMAIWFAPALVVFNELGAIEAMKLSFVGCMRNIMPFLVFGLAGLALAIVATIPLGLGWLALMPTMIGATYVAYREIFLG